MIKLKSIIRHLKSFGNEVPKNLSLTFEALVEDDLIEQYIIGERGQNCLSYDDTLKLKMLIVEFLSIYNSLSRYDHYTLVDDSLLSEDNRFQKWQSKIKTELPVLEKRIVDCDESIKAFQKRKN